MLHSPREQVHGERSSSAEAKRWASRIGLAAAIGILYFLAARLSLVLLTELDGVAVFWPAAGISAGALVALGPAARLPVVAGVMAATVAANLTGDRNFASAIVFGLCNAGEAVLTAWLIERHFGSGFSLDSLWRVIGLLVAAGIAAAVSGIGGTLGFVLFHGSTAPFLTTWYHWFASDALGIITVAPLLIGLARSVHDLPKPLQLMEGAAAIVVLGAACLIGFALPTTYWVTILPLPLLLPLLFWLAARCRAVFAAAAVFILALTVVWTVTFGIGRLGDPSVPLADRVQAGQAALLAIAWCTLALAGLFAERRRHEAALAERDARLALVEKTALVGSYAFDTKTGRVQISPGCAAIHGFPGGTSEIRRDDWRAGVQPDDLARYDVLLSQAFAERQSEYHAEYRIVRSSGEVRWIEARAFILYNGDGRAERVVGVNIDVTERKKAEAALEESDARYRALYDDNPSMYFTVDAAGTVLSVNEFGARQLGYAPAELVGQSVLQVIHEEERQEARQRLAWCAENPETIARTELRKVRRDGSILWVSEVVRAVREPGGQTVLLVVCEDITDLKRAEEHQNLLIAELDHRVKNVLATVAVVATRTGERSGSTGGFIDTLDHRLQSMAQAHALLSRSRWQGVSLAELVGQELAPYAAAGNVVTEGPHVGLTAAATQAMAMVLHELATNAAKYGALSTPQGRVSVRWDQRSNGGMPAALRLEWHEQGGPVVTVPAQSGYGTSVIRGLIPYELGGTVELEFPPDGVRCVVVIPDEEALHRDHVANPPTELAALR